MTTCETDGEYTWRLVAGDDSTRVFEYRDSEGDPVDLTGYTATMTYDVGAVSGTLNGVIDPLVGKVSVTMPDTITTLFRGNGEYRVRIDSAGGIRYTLVYGPMVVKL